MAQLIHTDPALLKRLEDWDKHDAVFDEFAAKSDAVDYEGGKCVGAMISFPVADGKAYYVCIKEKPLLLMHLPVWDQWEVPTVTIKGHDKQDVIANAWGDLKWRKLFEDKKAEQDAQR